MCSSDLPYATRTIGESNTVTFSDLPLGIYYVRQTELGEAGYVMTSYLATIPDKSGSYDATSFGKTDSYRKKPTKPSKAKTAAELQQDQFLMLAGISLSVLALVVLWRRKKEA